MADESVSRDRGASTTRAFIAIELPAEVKDVISGHIEDLKAAKVKGVKWVDSDIAHLTVAFLGDVPNARIAVLAGIVDCVASTSPPFSLRTGNLGAFPDMRRPRVVWMGLDGDAESLFTLQRRLQEALRAEGFALERRTFKPHVTLGRARGKGVIAMEEGALNSPGRDRAELPVRELAVMSSALTPRGPVHRPLHRAAMSTGSGNLAGSQG